MKYFCLLILFVLLSCGNKEDILLPKSNVTIVSNVVDHSPIYIFFRTKGKDTLAEVNRKNSIISTNWILNIDKRLPLRLVIPEVMKLQEKKRNSAHKSELAENYYSYADSIGKNMAFLPFTKVYYIIGEPADAGDVIIRFSKGTDLVLIDGNKIQKKELVSYVFSISHIIQPRIFLVFDKNMSYGEYIQTKILVRKFDSYNDEVPKEFIY